MNDNMKASGAHKKQEKKLQPKCDHCNDYDQDYKKTVKDTTKVKKENDDLRQKLKDMSKVLDQTLQERSNIKSNQSKPNLDQQTSLQVLERQVKNAEAQVKNYRKTLDFFEKKAKGDYSIHKINELQLDLKDKQENLVDLKKETKKLESEKRKIENQLVKDKPEKQLNNLREEIMQFKNRIRQQEKQKDQYEASYEKLEDHIGQLEDRQNELCNEHDISLSKIERQREQRLEKQRQQQQHNKLQAKTPTNMRESGKHRKETEESKTPNLSSKLTYDQFKKIEDHITYLKKNLSNSEPVHKKRMGKLEEQVTNLEMQKNEIKQQLTDKKSELEKSQEELQQIQQHMKRTSYLDMGRQLKRERAIRSVQAGQKQNSENARSFKDQQELKLPDDMYISEITIQSVDNYVIGLDVLYRSKKGLEKQTVSCFSPMYEPENLQKQVLKLSSIEYIVSITGYYSTHIEYIKIISSRGQYIYGGSDKGWQKLNKFSIECKKDEKPVSFFGTVDFPQKSSKQKILDDFESISREYVLVAIGLDMKKKNDQGQPLEKMNVQRKGVEYSEMNQQDEEQENPEEAEQEKDQQEEEKSRKQSKNKEDGSDGVEGSEVGSDEKEQDDDKEVQKSKKGKDNSGDEEEVEEEEDEDDEDKDQKDTNRKTTNRNSEKADKKSEQEDSDDDDED